MKPASSLKELEFLRACRALIFLLEGKCSASGRSRAAALKQSEQQECMSRAGQSLNVLALLFAHTLNESSLDEYFSLSADFNTPNILLFM